MIKNSSSDSLIKSNINSNASLKKIEVFDSIDSTNLYAKELAKTGDCADTLIIAETQTLGRGRLGRIFFSPEKSGIYMSLIIKAFDNPELILKITSAAAVAVSLAIENACRIKTSIKWVNDILINNKKLCGILTEAVCNPKTGVVEHIVVGIGINVYKSSEISDELKDIITSIEENIADENINPDRNLIIAEFINQFYIIINNLAASDYMNEYKKRSVIIGKSVTAISAGIKKDVFVLDIDDSGALVIRDENGEISKIISGEVSIRNIR